VPCALKVEIVQFRWAATEKPAASQESMDDAAMLPEMNAGWLDLATFGWITPLMTWVLSSFGSYRLYNFQITFVDHIAHQILPRSMNVKKSGNYNCRLARGESRLVGGRFGGLSQAQDRTRKQWAKIDGKQRLAVICMNDSVRWWVSSAINPCS